MPGDVADHQRTEVIVEHDRVVPITAHRQGLHCALVPKGHVEVVDVGWRAERTELEALHEEVLGVVQP